MANIKFNANRKDFKLIAAIADRAVAMAASQGNDYAKQDAVMDIAATHLNGNPLRLADLVGADDFNFSHDVFGIRRHLDRKTGELTGHFLPRFTARGA